MKGIVGSGPPRGPRLRDIGDELVTCEVRADTCLRGRAVRVGVAACVRSQSSECRSSGDGFSGTRRLAEAASNSVRARERGVDTFKSAWDAIRCALSGCVPELVAVVGTCRRAAGIHSGWVGVPFGTWPLPWHARTYTLASTFSAVRANAATFGLSLPVSQTSAA